MRTHLGITDILGFVLMDPPLLFRPWVFDGIEVWQLQNIDGVSNGVYVWSHCPAINLWPIYPTYTSSGDRFSAKMSWYFPCAIDVKWCPWTTGSKTSPNPHWPSLTLGATPCLHSAFASNHVEAVHGQNIAFWSHLTIALSSSHNSNEVWNSKCLVLFIVLSKGWLSATLPKSLLVWRCHFMVLFETWWP